MTLEPSHSSRPILGPTTCCDDCAMRTHECFAWMQLSCWNGIATAIGLCSNRGTPLQDMECPPTYGEHVRPEPSREHEFSRESGEPYLSEGHWGALREDYKSVLALA
jgi:hypothetical protein